VNGSRMLGARRQRAASRMLGAEGIVLPLGCLEQEGMTLPEYSRKERNCATKKRVRIHTVMLACEYIEDLAEHD
jgi:hypothetical protein